MLKERWQKVEDTFLAALDLNGSERASYLDEVCADDLELRREVDSLLAYEHHSDQQLAGVVKDAATSLIRDGEEAEGRLGSYRIVGNLGRGGMGAVYLAVRADDEYQKRVAIKIIKRGMDTEAVLDRFRYERQILASLDHPYIAKLVDGGTAPDGRPYLVMEYVDGEPLLAYCNSRRLTVTERLQLFRRVCEAVQYAHQNLVVHRDLKPSNILVTADGTPKLLDFGVAKILNASLVPGSAEPTLAAMQMATPAYASPEQVRGSSAGIPTDVYSLGVILYELLTDRRPYKLPARDSAECARIICEQEPARPSVRVRDPDTEYGRKADEVCQDRSATSETLMRRLRGDLDNIVLMALRKDPQRRYSSAEKLSDDIRRYLDGWPVRARKDTVAYRTRKFIGRHTIAVSVGGLVALALCITTAIAVKQTMRLSQRVAADRQLASVFVEEVYEAIAKLPGATPSREALLRQSLRYLNGLSQDGSDPATSRALASAYEKFAELQAGSAGSGLGQATAALETARKAQAIREAYAASQPSDHQAQLELVRTYLQLSYLTSRVGSAEQRTQYDQKAVELSEALVKADPENRAFQEALARSQGSFGYGQTIYDRWDEAEKHLVSAREVWLRLLQRNPDDREAQRDLTKIDYRIGELNLQRGRPAIGMEYLRNAMTIQERLYNDAQGDQRLLGDLNATRHFLGVSYGKLSRFDEARKMFNLAIESRERQLEADPRDSRTRSLLAGNYSERGKVELRAGDKQAALASLQQALQLQEAALALDPRAVASRLYIADQEAALGAAYAALAEDVKTPAPVRLTRWKEAVNWYQRSMNRYNQLAQEGHVRSPQVKADMARAKTDLERALIQAELR